MAHIHPDMLLEIRAIDLLSYLIKRRLRVVRTYE